MKNYYVIVCEYPMDIIYHVFDDEDLFRYSANQLQDYTDEMVRKAFKNEETKWLALNPNIRWPKIPYTEDSIREEFEEDHQFYPGELSRIIGDCKEFGDLKAYTNWLMRNKKKVRIVETIEGICP